MMPVFSTRKVVFIIFCVVCIFALDGYLQNTSYAIGFVSNLCGIGIIAFLNIQEGKTVHYTRNVAMAMSCVFLILSTSMDLIDEKNWTAITTTCIGILLSTALLILVFFRKERFRVLS